MKKTSDGYIVANVRSMPDAGLTGFYRAGRRWSPDNNGDTVAVSADVYKSLQEEPRIFVRTDVDLDGFNADDLERVDMPKRFTGNANLRALEESRKLDLEIEMETARLEVASKRQQLEELRSKRQAEETKVAAQTARSVEKAANEEAKASVVAKPVDDHKRR